MKKDFPFKAFGERLAELRANAGLQQSDVATSLEVKQQTVSRWEKGTSRPSAKQLPILAALLNASNNELLVLAGRAPSVEPVASFIQPFPLWALTPEAFETFMCYFLEMLYPSARVHPIGSRGHTQDGTDVEATFADDSNYSFQCKRHSTFGPEKVAKAVKTHTWTATKKFIVLTRPASPQARLEIKKYSDWDIWDVEDVSRKIRGLSKESQRRLVDNFFRGQRLALLGEPEPGPWQTSKEFFAAFSGHGAFSHAWDLVGRAEEVQAISSALSNLPVRVVFLAGPGGAGKSRILKEAIETYEKGHADVLVRFVSPTEEITNKDLDDLGDRKKVIVVDDAHDDRGDLQLLFQYVAAPTNNAKLLLSFRPYGLDYIKAQASNFALIGELLSVVRLESLKREQVEQLATQVLKELDGPVDAAQDIARLTLDCPLATVIGAQIVAKEKKHLEFLKNEDIFRSTLLGKFQDIIAGEIGTKGEAESIKKLLRILALVQPFYLEDESIPRIAADLESLKAPDTKRLIRLLTEAGVLFKRGGKYRLSPDLLADYIIEQSCVSASGNSSGYAELVFDAANESHVEQILVNLGKLDWRRANGDPSNSRLLDGVWSKLKPSRDYSDSHMKAVTAVAYYQPERALAFAEGLIRDKKHLRDLPNVIKYAGYNLKYLPRACECLWELGKTDNRALHQTPEHAVRILSELCAVEPNKPRECNELVVEFGLALLDQEDSWNHAYTPFDILKGIMQTEGHTTTSNGRNILMSPYVVNPGFVATLREKVIDTTIKLLSHTNINIAVKAARFLNAAVHYPMGLFNLQISSETRDAWTEEFVRTLNKVEKAAQSNKFDSLVLIEIVKSVSWHANYADGKTTPVAKRLVALLPNSLEFRTTATLIDGYGRFNDRRDYKEHEKEWNLHLETLTKDLISTYPDSEQLRSTLASSLARIKQNYEGKNISPHTLYWKLIQESISLAKATVIDAVQNPESETAQFAGMALSKLLNENYDYGLDIAHRFLQTDSQVLHAAIGYGYAGADLKNGSFGEADWVILRDLLARKDEWIVLSAIGAVRTIANSDPHLAIKLLRCIDFSISDRIADEAFMLIQRNEIIPIRALSEDDIAHFLAKLMQVTELESYWVQTFLAELSEAHPYKLADFFMARVEHAVKEDDWNYRPCNHGPYVNVPLRFRESNEAGLIFKRVWEWMKSKAGGNYHFEYRVGHLFESLFQPYDIEFLNVIQSLIDSSTPADIRLIARILSEAPPMFVFEHREFVIRFLDKAKQCGKDILDISFDVLYRSSVTGLKSGSPGEPFPQDVNMKDKAEAALNEISRFSPAYKLYEQIRDHATQNIQRSLQEREYFDE